MPTPHTAFRLTAERLAKLDSLAKLLGPVKPLSRTDVVNYCIDKAYEMEAGRAKGRAGKPARAAGEGV